VFPNLVAYSQHASVGIYDAAAHLLRLRDLRRRLVADNLTAQVDFLRRITAADPEAAWTMLNATISRRRQLAVPPAHQAVPSRCPARCSDWLADCPAERVRDYVETERRTGVRWLGGTGSGQLLTSFAPLGPAELRAFVHGVGSLERLADADIAELAAGW